MLSKAGFSGLPFLHGANHPFTFPVGLPLPLLKPVLGSISDRPGSTFLSRFRFDDMRVVFNRGGKLEIIFVLNVADGFEPSETPIRADISTFEARSR